MMSDLYRLGNLIWCTEEEFRATCQLSHLPTSAAYSNEQSSKTYYQTKRRGYNSSSRPVFPFREEGSPLLVITTLRFRVSGGSEQASEYDTICWGSICESRLRERHRIVSISCFWIQVLSKFVFVFAKEKYGKHTSSRLLVS